MYRARLATQDDVRNSRDAWNALALTMRFPTVFCTWEWIQTWWEHFGAGKSPLTVFIHENDELKGILPLFVFRTPFAAGAWLSRRVLSYAGTTDVYPDHLDIVCAAQDASECMKAVERFLSTEYREWDAIYLPLFTADSGLGEWVRSSTLPFDAQVIEASVAPFIPLAGDFEGFLGSFDKKARYNMRSRKKKLQEKQFRY